MNVASLKTCWVGDEVPYTGSELRPHYLLSRLKLEGSALAAFAGPCQVDTESLVDWEDRLAGDSIRAARMLHFLGEFFGLSLREGVLLQRLVMAIIGEKLRAQGVALRRSGDDLYDAQGRKLSVSIATASPVSVLLHCGLNIDPTGAPVAAVGLAEWGIDPAAFAVEVLAAVQGELDSVGWACAKVRPVV